MVVAQESFDGPDKPRQVKKRLSADRRRNDGFPNERTLFKDPACNK
jgi:hypothetical protein